MLDSRERFSLTADLYHRYRPSYPASVIDWIVEVAGLAPEASVIDLGCGTGIVARLFADRGYDVTGVDPNETMLAHARTLGKARYVRGEATAMGCPDASADLVTVAQAFHWFDVEPTLREIARVLRPGGHCAVLWNLRADTPLLREYEALLATHSAEREQVPRPEPTIAALVASPSVLDLRRAEFPNAQRLDRDGLFGRVYSSSYVAHGVADRAAFDAALGALFEKYQERGNVELAYRTVALVFAPRRGTAAVGS